MSAPTKRPGHNSGIPVDDGEGNEVQAFEEIEGGVFNMSYRTRIDDFLQKCSLQSSQADFYLWKYDNPNAGEQKSLVGKYHECDEPPDEDDVARTYGAGRYMLGMVYPETAKKPGGTRVYKFKISPQYTSNYQPMVQSAPSVQNQQPVIVQQPQQNTAAEFMAMMQSFLSLLLPVLRPPENPDISRVMAGNVAMIQDVMRKQMTNTVDLMADYQRKVAMIKQVGTQPQQQPQAIDDGDDEEGGVNAVISQIAPLLTEWLPKLIGGGPQAQAVSSVVKGSAMFKEITRNRRMVAALIAHLDSTQGEEETNKALKALNIKRLPVRKGA